MAGAGVGDVMSTRFAQIRESQARWARNHHKGVAGGERGAIQQASREKTSLLPS